MTRANVPSYAIPSFPASTQGPGRPMPPVAPTMAPSYGGDGEGRNRARLAIANRLGLPQIPDSLAGLNPQILSRIHNMMQAHGRGPSVPPSMEYAPFQGGYNPMNRGGLDFSGFPGSLGQLLAGLSNRRV